MKKTRPYGEIRGILSEFGSWTNFCLEKPQEAAYIYGQLRIVHLGKAFVECYAGSRKIAEARIAKRISRDMSLVFEEKGLVKDRQMGLCSERSSRFNDFRSMEEIINEGDADGLRFESFLFGNHDQVPFGNTQRNYPDSYQDGDPTSYCIEEAIYDMKIKRDFEIDSQ